MFRGQRGDMINVLWWASDGPCLLANRLKRADSLGREPTAAAWR